MLDPSVRVAEYLVEVAYALDDPTMLFHPDVLADPRPFYDELRDRAPVWRIPGRDMFLVSDPAVIREIVARTDDFSSNLVSMVHRGEDGGAAHFGVLPYRDMNHVLAVADPPDHTRHRKLLQAHLSPAAVASVEPDVRALTARRLAPMLESGRGDAVSELADAIPAATICRLLGLPTDDADELVPLVVAVGALLDGMADTDGMHRAGEAAMELATYADAKLDSQRERAPGARTPLFGALIEGVDAGEITADEAVGTLVQLFTAGTETTQSLIATTIEKLARDAELQTALRKDLSGIPEALETILREDGPFQFHYRWVPTEVELAGQVFPAGSVVLLMWAAANRPGDTDASGRRAPHLAFGRGIHFCIGAALARLESRVVIEELLSSTRSFVLDPDRAPQRRPSIMLRRHASLPLVVGPAGDHA